MPEMLEQIDYAIGARKVLSIDMPEQAEPDLTCIPIQRSEELLLVYVFYGFHPDGFRVIRLDDIYEVLRDGSEAFFEQILLAEGIIAALQEPPPIHLGSWQEVLSSLQGRYDCCIVECDGEEDILIGRVMEIGEWDFTFWYFDATGKWDEELDVVDYDDLVSVSFDDSYTNTIIKYISCP